MKIKFGTNVFVAINSLLLIISCANKSSFEEENKFSQISNLESLSVDGRRICSDYEKFIFESARSGNFVIVMEYLENGGDPNLTCVCDTIRLDNGKLYLGSEEHLHIQFYSSLVDTIIDDGVVDFIIGDIDEPFYTFMLYYLTLEIAETTKSDYLAQFIDSKDSLTIEFVEYLVSREARYNHSGLCLYEKIDEYKALCDVGYDFNLLSKDGKSQTLLMELAQCPCDKIHNPEIFDTINPNNYYLQEMYDYRGYNTAQEIIEIMKIIIACGADLNIKNSAGQTALDLAINPDIAIFLKEQMNK